jgi:hypothetical protein
MTDNLATRLQQLRDMREQVPEELRNQFDEQIAALEMLLVQTNQTVANSQNVAQAAHGSQARQATVSGQAHVDNLFQGDIVGNVYLYGQRGKSATEMIGAYLQRQLQRCDRLPLQGVYQQKAADRQCLGVDPQ